MTEEIHTLVLCSEEKRPHLNICFSDFWRRTGSWQESLFLSSKKDLHPPPLSIPLYLQSWLTLLVFKSNTTFPSGDNWTFELKSCKKKKKKNLTPSLLDSRIPRCPEHYLCWCSNLLQYWGSNVSPCHSLTGPNTADHLRVWLDQSTPAEGRAEFFHRAVLTKQYRQFPTQIDKDLQSLNPIQDLT